MVVKEKLLPRHYRYHYIRHHLDEITIVTKITLIEYVAIKETPSGYWLNEVSAFGGCKDFFVLKESKKRWAYPTKDEAIESLKQRSLKRKTYLKRDLRYVEDLLDKIEKKEY